VSEVFESAAAGRALLVVLAVPVRSPDGQVIGIIGAGQRLQVIREGLLPIEIPGGDFYVVDRKGRLVFHRRRARPEQVADYAGVPVVQRLLAGETGIVEAENPVEGEVQLSAYRTLPSLGWGVVVHRSENLALANMRTLTLLTTGAGLVLAFGLAVVGVIAIRNQRRTAHALVALEERRRTAQETQDELRRANAFLDSILENIPSMIFVKDAQELRFVRFNRAGEELLGYSKADLLGKNDYDFFPRAEADFFTGKDREVLAERKLLNIPEEPIETRARGTRILHTKKIPIVDHHGNPQFLLGISEDITELKEAQDALRQAKEEAERASRAKSEFLSRMSHELRTPLNAILGFGQLLEMDSLDAEQRDSVAHILGAGRHLLGLIDEVLDIARIEAGRLTLSLEPVDMRTVLDEVRSLIRPLAEEGRVEVRAESPAAGDLYVLADRQRLKQVLLNLLSNAVKYNREAGSVTVWCDPARENRVRLNVRDTGPGIPPDKLGHLFTPFERLGAETTRVEGTGLGLALSKGLMDAMGGAIGVESTPGQGSLFWVDLRRAEALEADLEPSEHAETPARQARRGTLLYVEDNLSNLQLIERLLSRRPGIKLLSAMQGRLGLELAREHRPGLILLDLHLPDVHGSDVLRRLLEDARTRDIPVVIITADASPKEVERLRAAGARDYLTKPIDVRRFLAIVDEMLATDLGTSDG
jgi:PAS domain S-box-containing protein